MRRVSTFDEVAIKNSRWTARDSELRDKLLGPMRGVLMPLHVANLSRMLNFKSGSCVREATLRYLRETWLLMRDKFIGQQGGRVGVERNVEVYFDSTLVRKRSVQLAYDAIERARAEAVA